MVTAEAAALADERDPAARGLGSDRFMLRAPDQPDAIRTAGMAAATLAEVLADAGAAVDLSGIALVVGAR